MTDPLRNDQPPDQSGLIELDRSLLTLLRKRQEFVAKESLDSGISRDVSQHVTELLKTPEAAQLLDQFPPDVVHSLLRVVVGASLYCDANRPRVSYLGPPLSYSYLATARYFSEAADLTAVTSIATVFDDVASGRSNFGVVPIENSTDGRVIDTLSTFADSPIGICGEILFPIHHCLLGQGEISAIKTICSKPQALSQCRKWLATHLPSVKTLELSSTTAAAELAAQDPQVAAIASYEAGLHYGLKLLARNVEDVHNNVTRFAVVGRNQPQPTGNDKTSIMFQIPHRSGALADAMQTFQSFGLNLTWIESFPIRGNPNEYLFFVELDGHRQNPKVTSALENLSKQTIRFEWLGSYPKAVPLT